MQHDDDLNNFLSRRAIPGKRPDLAERIIFAAVSQIQGNPVPARNLWAELMGMIALPHPSVIVATVVIIGLMVGVEAGDGLSALDQDWSSFLYVNEGGWL